MATATVVLAVLIGTIGVNGYTCPGSGFYLNPDDQTCQTFFQCIFAGALGVEYSCATGLFSETNGRCSVENICALKQTFECPDSGYYINPADSTCRTFYQCPVPGAAGVEYSCAVGKFSPTTKDCRDTNICVFDITTVPPTNVTTSEAPTTAAPNTTTTAGTTLPALFVCTEPGRFSANCTAYYMCQLQGTVLVQRTISCPPNGYNFNPSTQTCQLSYKCPP